MAYLIDRELAARVDDIVAILPLARPGRRSSLVLRDGGLRFTLTRPTAFRRWLKQPGALVGMSVPALLYARPKQRGSEQE